MLCRRLFHKPAFKRHRLLLVSERCRLPRVGDRQGQLVDEFCQPFHWQVKFMLCGLYSKWDRAREGERERKRKRKSERERECLGGSCYVQDKNCIMCSYTMMLRILYGKLYLCYVAYVYNGELVSLIGNQRVGILPPKSKILFSLSLALIWCQNFQDWTIPVKGDTWPSCSAERRNKNEKDNIRMRVWSRTKQTREQCSRTVTRPSADFQTKFFRRFRQLKKIW